MTNEEKAQKIIGGGCNKQCCRECGGSLSVAEGCVEFRHLIEMAKWKEKQMIEKACDLYREELIQFNNFISSLNSDYAGLVDVEKSYKDFRKAMKGCEQ